LTKGTQSRLDSGRKIPLTIVGDTKYHSRNGELGRDVTVIDVDEDPVSFGSL
jgi:hypothetical protein